MENGYHNQSFTKLKCVEVEWLESDGNCYINLGFIQESIYKIETHVSIPVTSGSESWVLFGANLTTQIGTYYTAGWWGSGFYFQKLIPDTQRIGKPTQDKTSIIVDMYTDSLMGFGGSTKLGQVSITPAQPMTLFGSRPATLAKPGTRFYDFKYHSETLDLDLVPVRFKNDAGKTTGAMYDKISKQVFYNSGSGEFSFGPAVRGII